MHEELQKALGKTKTNMAIRIDRISKEILKNVNPLLPTIHNISTEPLGPGFYAAYSHHIVLVSHQTLSIIAASKARLDMIYVILECLYEEKEHGTMSQVMCFNILIQRS